MIHLTGRVTANAEVRSTKTDKKVVGFNLAVNRYYIHNGERKTETKFFDCAYWKSDGIAPYLKKGTLVELRGEVGAEAYIDKKSGEAVGVLTIRVDHIVLHGKAKEIHTTGQDPELLSNPVQPMHSIQTIPAENGPAKSASAGKKRGKKSV